jgi:hypothetical protein
MMAAYEVAKRKKKKRRRRRKVCDQIVQCEESFSSP